jgi:hypothetical protein
MLTTDNTYLSSFLHLVVEVLKRVKEFWVVPIFHKQWQVLFLNDSEIHKFTFKQLNSPTQTVALSSAITLLQNLQEERLASQSMRSSGFSM